VSTREPSGRSIGRLLREVLLGQHRMRAALPRRTSHGPAVLPLTAFDHLQREVELNLAEGSDVVSDRYLMSSLAYQAEEADREWVGAIGARGSAPDLTILLDIPVELAAQRRRLAGRPEEPTTRIPTWDVSQTTTAGWHAPPGPR